jgi:hypothetical protein
VALAEARGEVMSEATAAAWKQIEQQQKEIAELVTDGYRYRWLQQNRHVLMGCAFYSTEELDATIDAAIAAVRAPTAK